MYARGIFTAISCEMQYTGLTIVDVEKAADDVDIAIISYYKSVPSSLGALSEVSGVCNSDLTY